LPSNTVPVLVLGTDGALWAGTGGGLARLDKDGHWQTFSKASTQGGLPSDRVRALALGADGALWAGTGGGLARRDKAGRWKTYSKASTQGGLPNDSVLSLALGADGALWAGTNGGGLARLDKDGHWQTFSKATTQGGLPSDRVRALALGADGALWVGTNGGGLVRRDKDGRWQTYSEAGTQGDPPSPIIQTLAMGAEGALWVGTYGGGLGRLDKEGRWQTYSQVSTQGGLPDDSVLSLVMGGDGALWAGTGGGSLARLDKDGRWQTYSAASTQGVLLPDNSIWALARGANGALWIGTWGGGLARFDKDGHWQTYSKASTQGGLPNDSVLSLALGGDGALWVGTEGSGLARRGKDGRWQTYSKATTRGGLPDDSVRALALGADGALWAGTSGAGLARRDKDGRWQTYSKANTQGGLPGDLVNALVLGEDGALWVATQFGLARLDKDGSWQTYSNAGIQGGLRYYGVDALALGADGALWAGTEGGGVARRGKDGGWQTYSKANTRGGLPDDFVNALALEADGTLWTAINGGGGLARRDKDGGWQTYSKASTQGGLPDDFVSALAVGGDGGLWVGTWGGGLARRDKDGRWQTYSKANTQSGLPDDFVSALARGTDRALWVGTHRGGLGDFNRPLDGSVRLLEPIGKVGELTQAEQTIAVAAFDDSYLTQPGMFQYIWRLTERGLFGDRSWPEIKTRSSVYTATFPHDGAYQLRVVAVDRYGNRSEPRDIDFKVTLPKPRTLWETLVAAWPIAVAAVTGLYALAFIVLLWLARRRRWAFQLLSDAAWASWLTWPFFFLRHVPAVQQWMLEPWFQAVRRNTPTDVPFLDPPVSTAAGLPSEGTALVQSLRDSLRLWLHGRSGMGKSSVFAAWERAYFAAEDAPNLSAAVRRYGFVLIALPMRHYAALPVPEPNRPESWVLEAVRRQLEQFGFATQDRGLIEAMLRAGRIALALDGTNEADRDLAVAAFARQFPQVRLLVTSQALPRSLAAGERWEIWELPEDISGLRDRLLALWLGATKGAILSRRIAAEGLSRTVVSGYDLRLLADLAASDPEYATLPGDRVALYRAMLARAKAPDGEPLRLEAPKQLAWTMVTQRRRRIVSDDEEVLGVATLQELEREGLRIVRSIGAEHEFRHDQMRAFLAGLWLVDETPNLPALQKTATDAGVFGLNRRDQEELWGFVAPLMTSTADLEALWLFANNDPVERAILLAALQAEADNRGVTLVRVAQQHELEATAD
jgi:ligand-binding sensor domain-containing protein